jgi:hypothetical protein
MLGFYYSIAMKELHARAVGLKGGSTAATRSIAGITKARD